MGVISGGNLLDNFSLQHVYFVLFVAIVYLVGYRLHEYNRLKHFKGPFSTGISWWWHSRAVLSEQGHRWYEEVNSKYGPIARGGPNYLITSSPELWMHMNAVRSPYTRATWYYHAARLEPGKDNVFTTCDNDKHTAKRKKLISGYSGKENPTLEESIDRHVKELVDLIKTKYVSPAGSNNPSKPMDFASKAHFFTLDVVSDIGLGKPFGNLKADEDINEYLRQSEFGLRLGNSAWAWGLSWLRTMPVFRRYLNPSEEDAVGFGRMRKEARAIIQERILKPTHEKSDMISSWIRYGVEGDDLFQEVLELILAGSDTTASSLRAIMLFTISHPRVYNKLQAEIARAIEDGTAPASPEIISDVNARALPYLSAVVRESLRVQPPIVSYFPKVAPKGGDVVTVDGQEYFIPEGTIIGYSGWAMHRSNKTVYGEDAEVFRPERWLADESIPEERERLSRMQKTNDLIFGFGRWQCLGKTVGMNELHKCVFELLRNFDFALTNPHAPWEVYNSTGLFEIKGMYVDVTERA